MSNLQFLSHADYLSHPAYGASDIIRMGKSFAYWKYRKENPEPKTRPLVIGSVTHLLFERSVIGGKNPQEGILVYKEGSSLTKGFKELQSKNPNQHCIDEEEFKLCNRMVTALLNEEEVMNYIKDAIPEATLMGKFPGTDVMTKCRPDYLHKSRGLSINIKTSSEASESNFLYGARDYGYDWQSAFYIDILSNEFGKPFDEIHIVVEKTDDNEPCPIKIFSFGDDTLAWARSQIRTIIEKIPENEKANAWPKKKIFLETVDLPLHMRRVVSP